MSSKNEDRYVSVVYRCTECGTLTDVYVKKGSEYIDMELYCNKCMTYTKFTFVRTWPPVVFSKVTLKYFIDNVFGDGYFTAKELREYMKQFGYNRSQINRVIKMIQDSADMFESVKIGKVIKYRLSQG